MCGLRLEPFSGEASSDFTDSLSKGTGGVEAVSGETGVNTSRKRSPHSPSVLHREVGIRISV